MAQLLRAEPIPEAHMIREGQRKARDLLRARLVLVCRALRGQRAIGALLEKYKVETPVALPELPRLQTDLHTAQRAPLKRQARRLDHELHDRRALHVRYEAPAVRTDPVASSPSRALIAVASHLGG